MSILYYGGKKFCLEFSLLTPSRFLKNSIIDEKDQFKTAASSVASEGLFPVRSGSLRQLCHQRFLPSDDIIIHYVLEESIELVEEIISIYKRRVSFSKESVYN